MSADLESDGVDGLSKDGTGLNLGLGSVDDDADDDGVGDVLPGTGDNSAEFELSQLDLSDIDLDFLTGSKPAWTDDDDSHEGRADVGLPDTDVDELARQAFLERLRPNRGNLQDMHTYLDQDASGDWDPVLGDEGDIQRRARASKDADTRKAEERARLERKIQEWAQVTKKCDNSKHTKCQMVLTISLSTAKLKQIAANIPDKWPKLACLTRPLLRATLWENNISEKNILNQNLRQTRGVGRDRPDVQSSDPQQHGCWGCFDKEECSLRQHDPTKWPCDACEKIGEECELIRPPVKKLQCTTCKAKKVRCSYSLDPTVAGPCQYCQETGSRCVAGPTKDGFPIRYICEAPGKGPRPKIWNTEDIDEATFGNCSYCRQLGATCSLGAEEGKMPLTDKPPCKNCEYDGEECDGIPIIRKPKTNKSSLKKRKSPRHAFVDDESSATEGASSAVTRLSRRTSTRSSKPVNYDESDKESSASERAPTTMKTPPPRPTSKKRKSAATIEGDMDKEAARRARSLTEVMLDNGLPPPKKKKFKLQEHNKSATSSESGDDLFVWTRKVKDDRPHTDIVFDQTAQPVPVLPEPTPLYLAAESRLFHPIRYHSSEACSMCTSMKYSMLGKSSTCTIKHWQTLTPGTYMCPTCTDLRINILRCQKHETVNDNLAVGRNVNTELKAVLKEDEIDPNLWFQSQRKDADSGSAQSVQRA
ncbi:Hypothetical protein D9617_18g033140 [Elsinoe fawcettii]|nr:Hypothetical protein D9617_18g033140 [Elsinoe fawcettii]